MKKMILVFLLTFSIHHLVKAEDFVEFKGRDLSPVQQEQMADDLMDWSVENHAKAERKMIPEEYSAIKRYGRVDHDVVNEYMRAGEPKEFLMQGYGEALKSRVSHMRSVMNKLPNYKGTVYRAHPLRIAFWKSLMLATSYMKKPFYRLLPFQVSPETFPLLEHMRECLRLSLKLN